MIDPQKVLDFVHSYSIRREMALFSATGRPIHAWSAYKWIREAGLPVPPWFLEYLDGCADRLMKSPLEKPEQVAEALDMKATGRNLTECDRLATVQDVLAIKDMKPKMLIKDIFALVAKDRRISKAFVKNAYYEWMSKNLA
jgi:hypothetical protein